LWPEINARSVNATSAMGFAILSCARQAGSKNNRSDAVSIFISLRSQIEDRRASRRYIGKQFTRSRVRPQAQSCGAGPSTAQTAPGKATVHHRRALCPAGDEPL